MTLDELIAWASENEVPFNVPMFVEDLYFGQTPVQPLYDEQTMEVWL